MKLRLPLFLARALGIALSSTVFFSVATGQSPQLGNVVFVGDSITERVGYRQQVWKGFLDNGYTDKTNGANTASVNKAGMEFQMVGSRNSGTNGTLYKGQHFVGMHEGHASWYSGALAGTFQQGDQVPDYGGTRGGGYIKNWVSTAPGGAALDGKAPSAWNGTAWVNGAGNFVNKDAPGRATYTPDTIVLMVGINDHFGNPVNNTTPEQTIANIKAIVDMYREANPNANFVISSILPVGEEQKAGRYWEEKKIINKALLSVGDSWNTDTSKVVLFDGGEGLAASPMTTDGVHLTTQGELLFANNIARALGSGQRTLGKIRSNVTDVSKFTRQNMTVLPAGGGLTMAGNGVTHQQKAASGSSSVSDLYVFNAPMGGASSVLSKTWTANTVAERTLDLSLQMASGFQGNQLSICFGNQSSGNGIQIDVREGGVYSGNTLLYSGSQSSSMIDFRIVYVNAAGGVPGGYYVWRNGMLIGDALGGSSGLSMNGFSLGQISTATGTWAAIENIAWSELGAYAPDSENNPHNSFELDAPQTITLTNSGTLDWGIGGQGAQTWKKGDLENQQFMAGSNVEFTAVTTVKIVSPDLKVGAVTSAGLLTINTNSNNAEVESLRVAAGTTFKKTGNGTLTIGGGVLFSSHSGVVGNIIGGILDITGDTVIDVASVAGNRFDISSATLQVRNGARVTLAKNLGEFSMGTQTDNNVSTAASRLVVTGEGSSFVSDMSMNLGNQPKAGRMTEFLVEKSARFTISDDVVFCLGVRESTDMIVRSKGIAVTGLINMGHAGGANATINILLSDGGIMETKGLIENRASSSTSLTLDGGILKARQESTNFLLVDAFRVTGKGGTIDTNGFNITISTGFSGVDGMLEKAGAGELTLSGAAGSWQGETTIREGVLVLNNARALGSGSLRIVKDASLRLASEATVSSLSGESGSAIDLQDKKLTVNSSSDGTYAGDISGGAGVFEKVGSGVLTLTGTNSYGGGTIISGGGIHASSLAALGSGSLGLRGGGLLEMGDNVLDITNRTLNLLGGSGSAKINAAVTLNNSTLGLQIDSATSLVEPMLKIDGVLTLQGDNPFSLAFRNTAFDGVIAGTSYTIFEADDIVGTFAGGKINIDGNKWFSSYELSMDAGREKILLTFSLSNDVLEWSGAGASWSAGGAWNGTAGGGKFFIGDAGTSKIIDIDTDVANAAINVSSTHDYTFVGTSGKLTGTTSLVKNGAGKLTISNAGNDYSGGTTVGVGILEAASVNALGRGALTVNNGEVFINAAQAISGTNINGGSLTITNATGLGAGAVSVAVDGRLNLSLALTNNTLPIANQVTGAGILSIGIGGSWINGDKLSFASGFTGTLEMASGRFNVAAANSQQFSLYSVRDGGQFYLTGGTFAKAIALEGTGWNISGDAAKAGALRMEGGTIISGTVSLMGDASVILHGAVSGTISGIISGNNRLIKNTGNGNSTLVLSGVNTFSGGIDIKGGFVNLQNAFAAGTGDIVLSGGGNSKIIFSAVGGATYKNNLVLASSGGVVESATNTVLSGTIDGVDHSLSKVGAANLTFGAGTLKRLNMNAGSVSVAGNLRIEQYIASNENTLTNLMVGEGGSLTVTGDKNNATGYAGGSFVLANYGQANTITLNGTLNLLNTGFTVTNGGAANTVNIEKGGILNIKGLHAPQNAKANSDVPINLKEGGMLNLGTEGLGEWSAIKLNITGGTIGVLSTADSWSSSKNIVLNGALAINTEKYDALALDHYTGEGADLTFTGIFSGTGSLKKLGSGTLILTGANTYAGGTSISEGILELQNAQAASTEAITIDGGTMKLNAAAASYANEIVLGISGVNTVEVVVDSIFAGRISGEEGASFVKTGDGKLILKVAGIYSGGTSIKKGILSMEHISALGGGRVLLDGGALSVDVSGTLINALSGTGNIGINQDVVIDADNSGFAGIFNVAAGKKLTVSEGVGLGANSADSFASVVLEAGAELGLSGAGESYYQSISGLGSLHVAGGAAISLYGNNSYAGGTSIGDGTTVSIFHNSALGGGTVGLTSISTMSSLIFGASDLEVANEISLTGMVGFSSSSDVLSSGTMKGVIGGDGGLVKGGEDFTLVLSGENTYKGGTVAFLGVIELGNKSALGTGNLSFEGGSIKYGYDTTAGADSFSSVSGSVNLDLNGHNVDWSGKTQTNITGISLLNSSSSGEASLTTGVWTLGEVDLGARSELILQIQAGTSYGTASALKGEGTLSLSGGVIADASTLGVTDTSGFTGTWKFDNAFLQGMNLSALGSSNIVFNNCGSSDARYFAAVDTLVSQDVELSGTGLALKNSGTGITYEFQGMWTGTGSLKIESADASSGQLYVFGGDMSGFDGDIEHHQSLNGAGLVFGDGSTLDSADKSHIVGTGKITVKDAAASLTFDYGADNVTLTNTLDGSATFIKKGSGLLTVSGQYGMNGAVDVQSGILAFGQPVTLSDINLGEGTVLRGNSLTLGARLNSGAPVLFLDMLNRSTADEGMVHLSGALALAVPGQLATLTLGNYRGLTSGQYTLLQSDSSLLDLSLLNQWIHSSNPGDSSSFVVESSADGKSIVLVVSSKEQWQWDGTETMWTSGNSGQSGWEVVPSSSASMTPDGRNLLFADTLVSSNQTVNISGEVEPLKITVNNSRYNYAFTGVDNTSRIVGASTVLYKDGFGTLTMGANLSNTYGGGTWLLQGVLEISSDNALGTGAIHFAGGSVKSSTLVALDDVELANGFDMKNGDGITQLGTIGLAAAQGKTLSIDSSKIDEFSLKSFKIGLAGKGGTVSITNIVDQTLMNGSLSIEEGATLSLSNANPGDSLSLAGLSFDNLDGILEKESGVLSIVSSAGSTTVLAGAIHGDKLVLDGAQNTNATPATSVVIAGGSLEIESLSLLNGQKLLIGADAVAGVVKAGSIVLGDATRQAALDLVNGMLTADSLQLGTKTGSDLSTGLFKVSGGMADLGSLSFAGTGSSKLDVSDGAVDIEGVTSMDGGVIDITGGSVKFGGGITGTLTSFLMNGGELIMGGDVAVTGGTFTLEEGIVSSSSAWTASRDLVLSAGAGKVTTFDAGGGDISLLGVLSGAGNVLKTGQGILLLSGTGGTNSGSFTVEKGILQLGSAGALGMGNVVVDGGIFDLNGYAVNGALNEIEVISGSLVGASNYSSGKGVSVNAGIGIGQIDMGGLNAAYINSIVTVEASGDRGTQITGLTGNFAGRGDRLIIGSANSSLGASDAVLVFDNPDSSSVSIDDLTIRLTQGFMRQMTSDVPVTLQLTNAEISVSGSREDWLKDIKFSPLLQYLGYAVNTSMDSSQMDEMLAGGRISITGSGQVYTVSKDGASIAPEAGSSTPKDVYKYFDAYKGVIVDVDLTVSLPGAPEVGTEGLGIENLMDGGEGHVGNIVFNNSGTAGEVAIVDLINGTGDDGLLLHTEFNGAITALGGVQINKKGDGSLTLNGELTSTSGVSVMGGKLVLNGGTIIDSLNVEAGEGISAVIGGSTSANSISGAGTIVINDKGKLVWRNLGALTLDNTIEGKGMLVVSEGSLAIGNTGKISSDTTLRLEKDASLQIGNDATVSVGVIQGTGAVEFGSAGSVLELAGDGDTMTISNEWKVDRHGILLKTGSSIVKLATFDENLSLDVRKGSLHVEADNAVFDKLTIGDVLERAPAEVMFTKGGEVGGLMVHSSGSLTLGASSATGASVPAVSLKVAGAAVFDRGSILNTVVPNDNAAITATGTITLPDAMTLNLINFDSSRDTWGSPVPNLIIMNAEQGFLGAGDLSSWAVTLDKKISVFYSGASLHFSNDGKILLATPEVSSINRLTDMAQSEIARAGADLIWHAGLQSPDSSLDRLLQSVLASQEAGDVDGASRTMAAAAGSTVTSLLASQRGDFRQQQNWIRNRVAQMGVNAGVINEDMPYFNAWIQGNGGYDKLDGKGDYSGYTLSTWGGTAGFDVDVNEHLTIGAAFTASYGNLTAEAADSMTGDMDSYYVNLFARVQKGKWAHSAILTGGWNDASVDRTVAYAGDSYKSQGTTSGSSFGLMYEATYDIALNEKKTSVFQPLFNASILRSSMDAYRESGADAAGLNVGKMDATTGTLALGCRLMGIVGSNLFGRGVLGELRAQVSQDLGDKTNSANVAFLGNPGYSRSIRGAKLGATAVQFGVGLSVPVGEKGTVYLDGNTDIRSGATSVNGSVGYRYNF